MYPTLTSLSRVVCFALFRVVSSVPALLYAFGQTICRSLTYNERFSCRPLLTCPGSNVTAVVTPISLLLWLVLNPWLFLLFYRCFRLHKMILHKEYRHWVRHHCVGHSYIKLLANLCFSWAITTTIADVWMPGRSHVDMRGKLRPAGITFSWLNEWGLPIVYPPPRSALRTLTIRAQVRRRWLTERGLLNSRLTEVCYRRS